MQCLSGRQLLSPVSSTHVAPSQTPRLSCANVTVARGALRRVVMVRAESTGTSSSTSTADPDVEPSAADSEEDEFAISPTPPAPKSLITEENIISALSGDGNESLHSHFNSCERIVHRKEHSGCGGSQISKENAHIADCELQPWEECKLLAYKLLLKD